MLAILEGMGLLAVHVLTIAVHVLLYSGYTLNVLQRMNGLLMKLERNRGLSSQSVC